MIITAVGVVLAHTHALPRVPGVVIPGCLATDTLGINITLIAWIPALLMTCKRNPVLRSNIFNHDTIQAYSLF